MYHRPPLDKGAYVFSSEVVGQVRPVAALEVRDVQKGPIMIRLTSCVVELRIVSFICTMCRYKRIHTGCNVVRSETVLDLFIEFNSGEAAT